MKERTLEELIDMLVKQYEINGCSFDALERLHVTHHWYVGYIDEEGDERAGLVQGTPRAAVLSELERLSLASRRRMEARLKEIDAEIAGLASERGLLTLALGENDG